MARTEAPRSATWTWLNIGVILFAAAIVLYPPFRHSWAFAIAALVLLPVYFIGLIRHLKANGTGNVPMGELHSQVKAGRRLPRDPLETAAAVAILLATIFLMRG